MPELSIAITGLGMLSPVGVSMSQTCSSVRAGINRFAESAAYVCEPEVLDWEDEPYTGSMVPLESDSLRIAPLVVAAVQDLVCSSGLSREMFDTTDIAVILPHHCPEEDVLEIERKIIKRSADPSREVRIFRGGSAAFMQVFSELSVRIQSVRNRKCVIVAADSFHYEGVLQSLDQGKRLKSKRNRNGFIPGEAAAAILIENVTDAINRGADVLATISGVGTGSELHTISADRPASGHGMARTIRQATGDKDCSQTFAWVASDLNGESYRASEWGTCQVILSENFSALSDLWHPADCLGDVGTASGAVLTALAARAFVRGYAPSEKCLVLCSSDDGARGALVLQNSKK